MSILTEDEKKMLLRGYIIDKRQIERPENAPVWSEVERRNRLSGKEAW